MSEFQYEIDRRVFLRSSVAITAAGAVGIPTAVPQEAAGSSLAPTVEQRSRRFLSEFVNGWLPLKTAAAEASWAASTDVSEAHTAAQVARNIELNRYVGSPQVIDTVRNLLEHSRAGSGDPRPR